MAKVRIPHTRHQKGHAWATGTLAICGIFSIYANVRSGQIATEPVVISVFPPIVAFLTSKLIAYFNPKGKIAKIAVYGGFGIVCLISMGASGFHIVDTVVRNGQEWYVGLMYVFITDAPMLLAAGILVQKVPTAMTAEKAPEPAVKTVAAKATSPAKAAAPAKTTKPPAKRTSAAKTTKPSRTQPTPSFSAKVDDPAELSIMRDGA
jgi:hypothetical protein